MPPLDPAFFVSDDMVERPVTLADGTTHTIHFREVTATQVRAFQIAEGSSDETVRSNAMVGLLCASVCNPDGTPGLTREQAQRLKPRASTALVNAILIINGMRSDEAKKDSPPEAKPGSGTSSRSRSAARRSKSLKRA